MKPTTSLCMWQYLSYPRLCFNRFLITLSLAASRVTCPVSESCQTSIFKPFSSQATTMPAYTYDYFNVTFPKQYVAQVEINRPQKLNAFIEVYVCICLHFCSTSLRFSVSSPPRKKESNTKHHVFKHKIRENDLYNTHQQKACGRTWARSSTNSRVIPRSDV